MDSVETCTFQYLVCLWYDSPSCWGVNIILLYMISFGHARDFLPPKNLSMSHILFSITFIHSVVFLFRLYRSSCNNPTIWCQPEEDGFPFQSSSSEVFYSHVIPVSVSLATLLKLHLDFCFVTMSVKLAGKTWYLSGRPQTMGSTRVCGWESKRPYLTLERKEGIFFFLIDLITRSDPVYRIRHVMVFSKCSCPVIFNE